MYIDYVYVCTLCIFVRLCVLVLVEPHRSIHTTCIFCVRIVCICVYASVYVRTGIGMYAQKVYSTDDVCCRF